MSTSWSNVMTPTLRLFSLAAALTAPIAAQQRVEFAGSLRDATRVEATAVGVEAAGWDYRAEVRVEGMTFTPALGSSAPTTQRLSLTPRQFGRADGLQRVAPATPVLADHRTSQARGAGVTERYEVTPAGLELSWRFATKPSGSGDLVVRYDLASTMPLHGAQRDLVSFCLPDVGGVSIGAVKGVDALGREAAGALALDGDVLELRLPSTFVDAAAYPLVLDPLIGTQFLPTANANYDDTDADVAYNRVFDRYLVVHRRVFSATDQVMRGQRLTDTGSLLGGLLVLGSADYIHHPTVAHISKRGTWIVAWETAPTVFSSTDIDCCAVYALNGAVSATTTIASGSGDETDPDAAGDTTVGVTSDSDGALITYRVAGGGIRLARVECASNGAQPTLVSTTTISNDASAILPAISKSNPGTSRYVVTWREPSLVNVALRARACDRLGNLLGNPVTVSSGSILLSGLPGRSDVDGDGTDFVVLYEYGQSPLTSAKDIYARGVRWDGATLVTSTAAIPISTVSGIDKKEPAIAFCRHKYVALYAEQFLPGTANYDIRGVELSASCTTCGPSHLFTGLNGTLLRNVEHMPAICSEISSGGDSDKGMIVFTESDDGPPFTSSVVAHFYEALAGTPTPVLGTPCGTTATIGADGPFAVGNADFAITVDNLPLISLPLINVGAPGATYPVGVCSNCVILNPFVTIFVPPVGTSASFSLPLGCPTISSLGTQLDAQWSIFSPSHNTCGGVGVAALERFAWTARLRLTLTY